MEYKQKTNELVTKTGDAGYAHWFNGGWGSVSPSENRGVALLVSRAFSNDADKMTGLIRYPDEAWAYPVCEISRDDFERLGYSSKNSSGRKNEVSCRKCPGSSRLFTIL